MGGCKHIYFHVLGVKGTICPFAVIQYYPDRETENLLRVCTLFDTISSDLFRDTLFRFVNPTSLEFEGRLELNPAGSFGKYAEVLPNSRLRSKDTDLLFWYNYLRKNCGISQHKCGWGFLPDTNDQSLAACIDRLMVQRNSIAASMKCGISESNFQEIWRKLRDDIIEIEQQVIGGNAYEQRVHDLFSMPVNQLYAVKYVGKRKHVLCSSYCNHINNNIKTYLRYCVDLSCLNPLNTSTIFTIACMNPVLNTLFRKS